MLGIGVPGGSAGEKELVGVTPAGLHSSSLKSQGQKTLLANVWDIRTVTLGFLEVALFFKEKEQWSQELGARLAGWAQASS